MIFPNKTAFTSDPIDVNYSQGQEAYLTVTGPGPVAIEILQADNAWRSFPETTFDGPTAQLVAVPCGKIRVVVTAATATTVGIDL